MAIDWAAAGTWMQAWAGFAQAAAIAYAAHKAADVFASWRRQKIEERRIAIAERILAQIHKFPSIFLAIRSPVSNGFELERARENIKNNTKVDDGASVDITQKMLTAQSIIDRVRYFQDDWDELNKIIPLAVAIFGNGIRSHLDVFWQKKNEISLNAEFYADDDGRDRDFSIIIRSTIWHSGSDKDVIFSEIDNSVKEIDRMLRPTLAIDV